MADDLTLGEQDWLRYAYLCGYDAGFETQPLASLTRLVLRGFIERDPQSRGSRTRWRITADGENEARQRFGRRRITTAFGPEPPKPRKP